MEPVENWRKFFKSSGIDIITLIEYAIKIAAADFPKELDSNRDRIAQTLYAPSWCCDYDCVTLAEPHDDDKVIDDDTVDEVMDDKIKSYNRIIEFLRFDDHNLYLSSFY